MSNEQTNLTPEPENTEINDTQTENTGVQTPEVTDSDGFQYLGDPTAAAAPAKTQRSLAKKLMPVFILLISAALLFTAAFVLKKVIPQEEETDYTEDTGDIEIFNFTGTTAERMDIENQTDTYAFVRKLEKTYYVEGHEDCPVSNSTILSALTYFGSLRAVTEVATDVTDFEQYGLKEPISKVTWTKGDTVHYIEIGDVASSGNYYMRVDGQSTVYTLSSTTATMFLSPRIDFYSTDVYDFDESSDAAYINYMTLERKGKETIEFKLQDLTDESVDSAYVLTAPIDHNMSIDKSSNFTTLLGDLVSLTVFDDDLSAKNLAKYGLDDPSITFSFVNVAEKHVLHFGNTSDKGYVYMYKEGNPFIYIVDADTINVLTYELTDYCESMSYLRSYDTVDSLTITGGGKTYDIDITGDAENDDLKAYINNKYVEYANFAELYAHIISIEFKDTGEKQADDELLVTITVNCKDGTKDVLKYYKQSELNSFYELNGSGRLIVSTAKVEQILEFAQKLYDGQEFTIEW